MKSKWIEIKNYIPTSRIYQCLWTVNDVDVSSAIIHLSSEMFACSFLLFRPIQLFNCSFLWSNFCISMAFNYFWITGGTKARVFILCRSLKENISAFFFLHTFYSLEFPLRWTCQLKNPRDEVNKSRRKSFGSVFFRVGDKNMSKNTLSRAGVERSVFSSQTFKILTGMRVYSSKYFFHYSQIDCWKSCQSRKKLLCLFIGKKENLLGNVWENSLDDVFLWFELRRIKKLKLGSEWKLKTDFVLFYEFFYYNVGWFIDREHSWVLSMFSFDFSKWA